MAKDLYASALGLAMMFFCAAGIAGNVFAYTPPVGIPNPDWGAIGNPIDAVAPSRPSNWPDNDAAGCYYINPDDPSATDAVQTGDLTDAYGHRFGYPDRPRKSVPDWHYPFAPGAYVEVHGSFPSLNPSHIQYSFNCTAAQPCWFRGTADDMPNIRADWSYRNTQYLFQEYFDFDGKGTATGEATGIVSYPDGNSHHIILRNSELHDRIYSGNSSGIGISAGLGDQAPNAVTHDIIIFNYNISRLGQWDDYAHDNDFHGIGPNLWNRSHNEFIHHLWILNSEFSYLGGDGVQVNAAGGTHGQESALWRDHIHHLYIGGNTAHHNRQSGFASKQATDVIISENVVHDMPSTSGTTGTGIMWMYGANNIWVLHNVIHDCRTGIRQSTTNAEGLETNVYVIGNVIYNIHPGPDANPGSLQKNSRFKTGQGISYIHPVGNRYTYYNTIYNCSGGISIAADSPSYTENNIISNIDNDDALISFLPINIPANSATIAGSDLCHDPDVQNYYWDRGLKTSLAEFQSASGGQGLHFIAADPMFADPQAHNFTLRAPSPARGAAVATGVFDKFESLYGLSIRTDMAGRPRMDRGGDDMGAYETDTSDFVGDVNGDGRIGLDDVILSLQIASGQAAGAALQLEADVNGDGKIGIPEAVFGLQRVSRARNE